MHYQINILQNKVRNNKKYNSNSDVYPLLVLKNYNKNTIKCYTSKNEFIRVLLNKNRLYEKGKLY